MRHSSRYPGTLKGKKNRRMFANTARKTHKRNLTRRIPRGGYHL